MEKKVDEDLQEKNSGMNKIKSASIDDRKDFDGVHEGSFPLESVKLMDLYQKRIVSTVQAPKHKYALCLGYLGTNYQGLQINPGALSIESFLERALLLCGGIIEQNYGNLQKIGWTRAARTDRGVHALSQCCSMKIKIVDGGVSEFIKNINLFLPNDIRVFAATKVSKSFNAKTDCSGRKYEYLLPTYLLTDIDIINDILSTTDGVDNNESNSLPTFSKSYHNSERLREARSKLISYRITDAKLNSLKECFRRYVGTHKYHNFTSNKLPTETSSQRYITEISISEPYVDPVRSVEWICISIVGQSFLLNQVLHNFGIRAIGLTILISYLSFSC